MLELIDLDKAVTREQYETQFPALERRLGECQRQARAAGVPVVIIFEGWEAAGKGTLINRLTRDMDPRGFKVHPIGPPTRTERLHPWMWRFWNALPAAGNVGIFDCSWYRRVLDERMDEGRSFDQCRNDYQSIRQFERRLAESGVLIVKFWLHLAKTEQGRRFRRLRRDPATAWKVGKAQRRQHRQYRPWKAAAEEMLQETSTFHAPWTIIEATQRRHSRLKVFQTLVAAIEEELARRQATPTAPPAPVGDPRQLPASEAGSDILGGIDLTRSIAPEEYVAELKELQTRLFRLEHELYIARVPVVVAYEGWDAAGKGGNIKRLTEGLDPRGYEVIPVAAPSADEKAHHYLWRFWRHLPKAGHITVFDRTWYGRVLVERVEGFCPPTDWRRAYEEINEFERELADYGTAVVKFWLHIDQNEQLRRFEDRQQTPDKQWKITDEDWRNRAKWPQYRAAVNDMLERTSTSYAPWTVLEANCKHYARIKALRTVAAAIEKALGRQSHSIRRRPKPR